MPFRPCPSGCGRFLSADDGRDRCLQCLGRRHAEAAFVDDSCVCCGRMSMISLRSRLSFMKGLAPSAATCADLSGSSRDSAHNPLYPGVARQFPESPASSPTKKNMVRPDYEHQIYNLYTKSAMDDIPFMIYKKSTFISRDEIGPVHVLNITIKSPQEIEDEYNYCFNTEHSAAAFTWTCD